jgi:8-oxo-dGTP pyrophosphatase MutT (NUDIX family)
VRADDVSHPVHGAEREVFVLESVDWVNVIALTAAREVVLIEQFRHGVRAPTLEIPGGMVDAGEAPLDAGLRELREETGYGGGEARLLGFVEPNPAMLDNRCWTVLVEGVELLGEPQPEEGEDIAVDLRPLDEVPGLISAGRIAHALVVAAFHHLSLAR